MFTFILWCLLFVFCWPLAILALVLYPIVWLLTLPFRLVGISVGAVFALLTALLFLPARALGSVAEAAPRRRATARLARAEQARNPGFGAAEFSPRHPESIGVFLR